MGGISWCVAGLITAHLKYSLELCYAIMIIAACLGGHLMKTLATILIYNLNNKLGGSTDDTSRNKPSI